MQETNKLMKEIEVDASSKNMFKIAEQSMKDRKDVMWHWYVQIDLARLNGPH